MASGVYLTTPEEGCILAIGNELDDLGYNTYFIYACYREEVPSLAKRGFITINQFDNDGVSLELTEKGKTWYWNLLV